MAATPLCYRLDECSLEPTAVLTDTFVASRQAECCGRYYDEQVADLSVEIAGDLGSLGECVFVPTDGYFLLCTRRFCDLLPARSDVKFRRVLVAGDDSLLLQVLAPAVLTVVGPPDAGLCAVCGRGKFPSLEEVALAVRPGRRLAEIQTVQGQEEYGEYYLDPAVVSGLTKNAFDIGLKSLPLYDSAFEELVSGRAIAPDALAYLADPAFRKALRPFELLAALTAATCWGEDGLANDYFEEIRSRDVPHSTKAEALRRLRSGRGRSP